MSLGKGFCCDNQWCDIQEGYIYGQFYDKIHNHSGGQAFCRNFSGMMLIHARYHAKEEYQLYDFNIRATCLYFSLFVESPWTDFTQCLELISPDFFFKKSGFQCALIGQPPKGKKDVNRAVILVMILGYNKLHFGDTFLVSLDQQLK